MDNFLAYFFNNDKIVLGEVILMKPHKDVLGDLWKRVIELLEGPPKKICAG